MFYMIYVLPACYLLAIIALHLTEEERLGGNILIIVSYLLTFFLTYPAIAVTMVSGAMFAGG